MRLPQWLQRAPQPVRAGLAVAAIFSTAGLIGGSISAVFFGGDRDPTVICFLLVLVVEMWAYDRYLS